VRLFYGKLSINRFLVAAALPVRNFSVGLIATNLTAVLCVYWRVKLTNRSLLHCAHDTQP